MIQPALFASRRPGDRHELPPAVLHRLALDGHLDPATGATRRARPAKCPRCGAWVVRGLDEDMMAFAVDADPGPLTPEGEALALLAGLCTYTLRIIGGRPELRRRDAWAIGCSPAGTGRADVLAKHRCDGPELPHGPSRLPEPPGSAPLPENPPF